MAGSDGLSKPLQPGRTPGNWARHAPCYDGRSVRARSFSMTPTAAALASKILPLSSEVSTTLAVGAGVAYEIFADVVQTPRWLPIVQSAKVLERTAAGRPEKVAFMGKLERGSLGYTLLYRYDDTS